MDERLYLRGTVQEEVQSKRAGHMASLSGASVSLARNRHHMRETAAPPKRGIETRAAKRLQMSDEFVSARSLTLATWRKGTELSGEFWLSKR
jgi:hypothetical protein